MSVNESAEPVRKGQIISAGLKIGYVVPEFPGQTHAFFWREIQRLEEAGLDVDLISTREPPRGLQSHLWTSVAQQRTTYLMSRQVKTVLRLVWDNVRLFPRQWSEGLPLLGSYKASNFVRLQDYACLIVGASLARLAVKQKWDHIHVHSCAKAAEIVMFAAKLAKIPYSITLHGALNGYGPHQIAKWGNAAFAITITDTLLGSVRTDLGETIAAKTAIVPMGVTLEKFRREVPYMPWAGINRARLVSVGRLNLGKGHDDLIKAVGCLRDRAVEVRLLIAGEDDIGGRGYRKTLESLIKDLGLADHVELLGAVDEDTVRRILVESHLFVLASHNEALGVAVMEAMALQVPVLVAAGGGVAELIEDQVDGAIFHDRKPDQIADSIEKLLSNPTLARQLSAAARPKIERSFSDRRSAIVLLEQIQKIRKNVETKT